MKKITKILIALAFLLTAIGINAQQECAVICHHGKSMIVNVNALDGHLKHGDSFISNDCDAVTGEDCTILSVPKFSFTKSYPFGVEYKVYDINGKELQNGLTYDNMQRNLPKTQIILLKVENYQLTKFYVE